MSKEIEFNCLFCGESHVSKNKYSCRAKFCSQKCQHDFTLREKVFSGEASPKTLKRFLIKTHGNKCWTCNITEWNKKPIVMDLEHIDGNSQNNDLNNLALICPNCHSQTSTYKGKNKGNGRHYRRIRYSKGKSY